MNRNLVYGLIAGILAPGVALGLVSAGLLLLDPDPNSPPLMAFFGSVWAGVMFSIPAWLIYALPLFLLFRAFRIANLYTCVVSAIAPIFIASLIPSSASTVKQLFVFAVLFLVSALAFWYFARRTIRTNEKHARQIGRW